MTNHTPILRSSLASKGQLENTNLSSEGENLNSNTENLDKKGKNHLISSRQYMHGKAWSILELEGGIEQKGKSTHGHGQQCGDCRGEVGNKGLNGNRKNTVRKEMNSNTGVARMSINTLILFEK